MKTSTAFSLAAVLVMAGVQSPRAQGNAFTYQGRLTDGGNPADGQFQMTFQLFTAATNGLPASVTLTNPVSVAQGQFNVLLDFGPGVFDGSDRWLELGARTNGSVSPFQILAPRQPVTATPYALFARTTQWTNLASVPTGPGLLVGPGNTFSVNFAGSGSNDTAARSDHNHFGQGWNGSGATGLAITNQGTGAEPVGIAAQVVATNGYGILGRQGIGSGFVPRSAAVAGDGDSQPGVSATSRSAPGVFADSYGGDAVLGWAQGTNDAYSGVAGISDSPTGQGVYGRAEAPTGLSAGVYGESASTLGTGVLGLATADQGNTDGVYGESFSPAGHGVYGVVSSSTGTNSGVYGVAYSGAGRGVYGEAIATNGVTYGVAGTSLSPNGAGVYGEASGLGIEGYAWEAGGTGVYGSGESGLFGRALSANGNGIIGQADNGTNAYAVWGISAQGYAGFFDGKVHVNGTLSKQAGSFRIDHPLDPENKWLYHSFVESPDMKNIYDGVAVLDDRGEAEVTLPEWFQALNRDFRYQLTSIGKPAPGLFVAEEIQANSFKIAGGAAGQKVSWQVTGIRQDPYAVQHRIPVEQEKTGLEKAGQPTSRKSVPEVPQRPTKL